MSVNNKSALSIDGLKNKEEVSIVNRITGTDFQVFDVESGHDFNINLHHPNVTREMQLWGSSTFVALCGDWSDKDTQTLQGRAKTARGYRNALLRIMVWASEKHPNTPLSQWTENHLSTLLQDALLNRIDWINDENQRSKGVYEELPVNRGAIENLYLVLIRSKKFRLSGKTDDGLLLPIPKDFLRTSIETQLEELSLSYDLWLNGEGWNAIPLPIAMTMLHEAISILRSKKAIFLRDYFSSQRKEQIFFSHENLFGSKSFHKYREPNVPRFNAVSKRKAVLLFKILDKHDYTHLPFSSGKEITQCCADIYDACLVIFLTLTGIRLSEYVSICANDFKKEIDGVWTFASSNIKTDLGLKSVRTMSGVVAEAAETMLDISFIDKKRFDGKRELLIGRYYTSGFIKRDFVDNEGRRLEGKKSVGTVSTNGNWQRLQAFYSNFCKRHSELVTDASSIHAHQFRHTWAEFAIRRFEGDVFEAIRRHFLHTFGSYFTTKYTYQKLKPEVKAHLEKAYLKEVLTKVAMDMIGETSNQDFHGKVVRTIKKAMDVTIATEEEVHEIIEDIAEDFQSIVAHEYGYCIVAGDTAHLAKCWDKEAAMPMLDKGCFRLCSGCPNFNYSEKDHGEEILRVAVSHQNMIDNFEKIVGSKVQSKAIDTSREIVRNAAKLLGEVT